MSLSFYARFLVNTAIEVSVPITTSITARLATPLQSSRIHWIDSFELMIRSTIRPRQ